MGTFVKKKKDMSKTIFYRSLGVILMTILSLSQSWAQCAMCRVTVENNVSAGDTSVASGLNTGILYLFVMPYLLFTIIAILWYRRSKKTQAQKISRIRYS